MTIAPISPTSFSGAASTAAVAQRKSRIESALAPVAQLFGESAQQLESELRSGKTSMTALAQSKGVSQSDLVDAIKKGLQDGAKAGGVQLSDTQLSNLANGIANRVHGGRHHLHRGVDAAGGVTAGGAAAGAAATGSSASAGAAVDADGDHDGTPGGPGPLGAPKPSAAHSTISRLLFELQAQAAATTATASKAAQTEIAEKFAASTPSPAPEPSRLDKVA